MTETTTSTTEVQPKPTGTPGVVKSVLTTETVSRKAGVTKRKSVRTTESWFYSLWPRKKAWLDIAEIIDSWRVMPRAVLIFYGYWMSWVIDSSLRWYFLLPTAERTGQVTAFIGTIVSGVFGLACWVFKVYSNGGRDWDSQCNNEQPK